VIDLLEIPGTWRRPNAQPGAQDYHPFDISTKDVVLYRGGEADWQFTAKGPWSASGHWKIVKGSHLSIVAIYADPVAAARGEDACEFYYHLVGIEDDRMQLRSPRGNGFDMLTWTRIACGREYGV
jgi:hypothetical protein